MTVMNTPDNEFIITIFITVITNKKHQNTSKNYKDKDTIFFCFFCCFFPPTLKVVKKNSARYMERQDNKIHYPLPSVHKCIICLEKNPAILRMSTRDYMVLSRPEKCSSPLF